MRRGKSPGELVSVTVEQLEPDVLRLRCRTWRGAAVGYDVSAYVVRGVLVDAGFPRVEAEFLRALDGVALRGAVVTHQHEDHAGAAAALAARGVPIVMHEECEAVLRARPGVGFYRRAIWGRPARLSAPVQRWDVAPLEVLHLPGHTPDHLALWDPEREILASGDLFLGVKVRVAHHDESPATLVKSLRRAAALRPRLLLDAHRGPVAKPAGALRAKADWVEELIGLIVTLADRGASEREIATRLLGREDLVGWVSRGEYSRESLVRAVLRERAAG